MSAARDGNGTFNRAYDWTDDAANSIPIAASRFDTEMDGIASELTNSVAKDGQTTMSGALKMGGFKVTGMANGSNSADGVAFAQMNTAITTAVDTAVATAYAKAAKVGEIIDFAGTALQTDFLATNGAAVSRTTYAALFTAIGTTWGAGDGSTTFNVPDLARRVTVGSGGSGTGTLGNAAGNTGGAETHTLSLSESPAHTHGMYQTGGGARGRLFDSTGLSAVAGATAMDSAGGGGSHNNMQPSAVVYKQIRYQ
jgi:microcystin-dependent protein